MQKKEVGDHKAEPRQSLSKREQRLSPPYKSSTQPPRPDELFGHPRYKKPAHASPWE